jgi:hypothetical protein
MIFDSNSKRKCVRLFVNSLVCVRVEDNPFVRVMIFQRDIHNVPHLIIKNKSH